MSLTQPLALLLVLLAIPTFAAYLHQRKRERKTVSSAILFRVIAGENTPTKRALSRPRHWVSLVLVLLALLTMVFAVVDLRDSDRKPHDYVVVLDTSASMGAKVPGSDQSRLDLARERLDEALEAMGPGDRVALVTSGTSSTVRIGFTEDLARVRELAANEDAAGSSAAMPRALRIADAMARTGSSRVVLLTDGVGVGVPEVSRMPELVQVGQPGPNIGINALAVREADSLGLTEVFIGLTADTTEARDVDITLRVDDQIVDVLSIEVPESGPVETLHRVELPEGDQLIATLSEHGEDMLAADDVATAPRRTGDRVSVLLVAPSRLSFAAEALRLHPRVDLTTMGPYDTAPHERYDLIILETDLRQGTLPKTEHLIAFGTDPASLGLPAGKHLASPRILRWSFDDSLFRFVDLTDIDLPRGTVFAETGDDVTSLVDTENGALAVRKSEEDRQVVYFGFAPAESDLVLRVGFVNMMANLVEWSAPAPAAADDGATVLPASETLLDLAPVPGTVAGDFDERDPADRPVWHWLVWFAAGLMFVEGMLALGKPLAARLRSAVRRATGGEA